MLLHRCITRIAVLLLFYTYSHTVRSSEESGYDFVCWQWEVSCGCGQQSVHLSESRLINGENAVPYSWSMLVSIRLRGSDQHACGGTVLNESYVLTSATCLAESSIFGITVAAGHHYLTDSNRIVRQVDGIFVHPNYTGAASGYLHDIAILHLAQPMNLSNGSYVSRSCIAQLLEFLPDPIYVPSAEAMLAVIGWGLTNLENRTQPAMVQQAMVYSANDSDPDCVVTGANHDLQFCAGTERRDKGKSISV